MRPFLKASAHRVTAIVPAAGLSQRMKRFKPLLYFGDRTVIENTIIGLQKAGIGRIIVITGFRAEDITQKIAPYQVSIRHNSLFRNTDMFASIRYGIEATTDKNQSFLVLPADMPLIRPSTISSLVHRFHRSQEPILLPTYQGNGGHPVIIDATFRESLMNWQGDCGLRGWMASHKQQTHFQPVADKGVTYDLDHPTQYQQALRWKDRHQIPTLNECYALLYDVLQIDNKIIAHAESVTALAVYLLKNIHKSGCDQNTHHRKTQIDEDLLIASALLHDICKGQVKHASAAARLLNKLGFYKVAEIVSTHMNFEPEAYRITEKSLLYLADKLVEGTTLIDPTNRFIDKLNLFRNQEVQKNILRRFAQFERVRAQYDTISGIPLEQILPLQRAPVAGADITDITLPTPLHVKRQILSTWSLTREADNAFALSEKNSSTKRDVA